MLDFHRVYWQDSWCISGPEYARVLNIFWKQLYNTFKFKYLGETLKNKICSKCIWPETWIIFLALKNIDFLSAFGKSLRNIALPTTLSSSLPIFPPISPTLFTLYATDASTSTTLPKLAHQPRHHRWHVTHASMSTT